MHIVTGELRKAPYIKDNCGQDGQSKMYILELSEVIKDYQTQEKSYTNYSAMIFAKSQGQKDYYDKSFVEGNWVSLTAEKLKVDRSECGQYIKLRMENARVESSGFVKDGQQQGGNQQQQNHQQQQQQQQSPNQNQARQNTNAAMNQNSQQQGGNQQQQQQNNFDDDIPF